ncbi:hypothetical protein C810_01489 [Lachnospiraceae bacterium A2]|nr:hypothetical protein C810_01489 [Lachnospiraceae bacterium A2]
MSEKEIMEEIHKTVSETIDREIMKCLGVEYRKPKELNCNPLEDLKNMIDKMSTVIMCSENNKKKLEEQELPGMTTIIPNRYLEDGKVYMVTDGRLKRDMLECERIRRLREKKTNKSN